MTDTPTLSHGIWTIPYVRNFRRTSAPIKDGDSVSFETELRTELQSLENEYTDPERLEVMDALLRQADELLTALGRPKKTYQRTNKGSSEYQKVAYALDLLLGTENELADEHKERDWEQTSVSGGRTGCEIVHLLKPLKVLLQPKH